MAIFPGLSGIRVLRLVLATINLPLWYLLGHLDEERPAECYAAVPLVSRLRPARVQQGLRPRCGWRSYRIRSTKGIRI
jgi:hypothetical protein